MGILSIFGYDRKSQDRYVDQVKLNRDLAMVDATKIDQAAGLILGQIPGIEAGAGMVFAAGDEAAAIGRANAANILSETSEWARRATAANRATEASNRARAAASGIRLGTGGSSEIYQAAVKEEGGRQVAWGRGAGASQADIARREGTMAQLQAYGQGESILATIPGIRSQALQFGVQAGALRQGAQLAVAEARANRASARSGAFLSAITTAIAGIGTAGALGFLGTAGRVGRIAMGATAVGAGGLALASIFGNKGSQVSSADLFTPTSINTNIQGVNVGGQFDASGAPLGTRGKTGVLPSLAASTETTKRQFAGQQAKAKKTELNIFGGGISPLAVTA